MKKKIIEITTLEELLEMSGAGAAAGHAGGFKKDKKMREELQAETIIRLFVRNQIKQQLHENLKLRESQEHDLRLVIRQLIKESAVQANPHPNTGINKLRGSFQKAVSTIKSKYQELTTSKEQRESFSAHLLRAFVRLFRELDALEAKGDIEKDLEDIEAAVGEAPDLGLEPPPDNELDEIAESIIREFKIDISDDEKDIITTDKEKEQKKSQTQKDFEKKKASDKEKEDFGTGLEGDTTGRNQAFDAFRLVQRYFADDYLDLSNEGDKDKYRDWGIYNLKLLLQKFEEELPANPEQPEIDQPEGA